MPCKERNFLTREIGNLPAVCAAAAQQHQLEGEFTWGTVLFFAEALVGPAQPGILPGYRDVLEVSAKSHVGAIAVTYFQALVLAQWD
jgi:hypothetical protein